MLLALDGSEFSRAAMEEIIRHLRAESTTVHILHVVELDRMLPAAFDFARGSEYGPEVAAHLDRARRDAGRLVADAAEQLRAAGFRAETVVREGEPRHTILNYATEIACDCIVIGSHGRRGVERFFMGSVSDSVVRHAHCSVFVVRHRSATASAVMP
jgi:nucleotide-binding universal stress UspA family protein